MKEEVKEKPTVRGEASRVAAFFDLDGTLIALPSLERRLFRLLKWRRQIRLRNYLLWLMEATRLAPRGIEGMLQANKMYLRGVKKIDEGAANESGIFFAQKSGHQEMGQASTSVGYAPGFQRSDARLPVPAFYDQGVERVVWHVKKRHAIALVSGTLEPLANAAARRLEAELAGRGWMTNIRVCATRLEEKEGRWTGKILGEAMFGEVKAQTVRSIAAEMKFDLAQCFAYGNSAADARMLETVGNTFAVNPSEGLARFAEERGWPTIYWQKEKELTQRGAEAQSAQKRSSTLASASERETERVYGERKMRLENTLSFQEEVSRSIG